jgi:hypothetical protein
MDNLCRKDYNMNLVDHLYRQWLWSNNTFGPGKNTAGLLAHIRSELKEVEAKPHDLKEWIDIAILAFDGALREGHCPEAIAYGLVDKQTENEKRKWPDWQTVPAGQPIEHIRDSGDEHNET